jgi:hypothetical protein
VSDKDTSNNNNLVTSNNEMSDGLIVKSQIHKLDVDKTKEKDKIINEQYILNSPLSSKSALTLSVIQDKEQRVPALSSSDIQSNNFLRGVSI